MARSYADMHGLGWKEKNRYGDALTWTSYYYSLFYARLFTVNGVKVLRRWKTGAHYRMMKMAIILGERK